ncbi:hypothetical protein BFF78_22880 [Streptomyces fodineus]|uniref:Chaplin domain-containing protein n=1 Tax=Streptomyces fodineus TaxID=1904616 RepID=A0A1D7YD22_9ACTN|nr:hypothetical protein [Streptomyces fodineus]AOR33528.1 hypothetical protein BFF78_22880 [Streptomyces fodineus]
MLKVLRTMATGVAAGLLLAVTSTTAHAQNTGYMAHAPAPDTDRSAALSDVTDLVGTPVNAGLFG